VSTRTQSVARRAPREPLNIILRGTVSLAVWSVVDLRVRAHTLEPTARLAPGPAVAPSSVVGSRSPWVEVLVCLNLVDVRMLSVKLRMNVTAKPWSHSQRGGTSTKLGLYRPGLGKVAERNMPSINTLAGNVVVRPGEPRR
jgi:hypothetical protein